jgi:uncharacterized membrane protein YgaE (UPF0421/DUF939 family)
MPLDYSILTAGVALAGVITVFFAVVKETNNLASKIEEQMSVLAESKQKAIDIETMSSAKEILEKHEFKIEELSRNERREFYVMVNASANLATMKNAISALKDKATRAYILGVACALSIILATLAYMFIGTDNPYSTPVISVISTLSLTTGLFYFRDGIFMLTTLRVAERAIQRMKTVTTVERLDEEVRSFLKRIEVIYLTVSD